MNIVLTGFMGTGKSAVGRVLAARLGWRFVDTDEVISRRWGDVATIFAAHGEAGFRHLERRIAIEVAREAGRVVATGGGMVLDRRNVVALRRSGVVMCLTASPEAIVARATGDGLATRPLLGDAADPVGRVRELLAERSRAYAQFPSVATDGRTPRTVSDRVLALL